MPSVTPDRGHVEEWIAQRARRCAFEPTPEITRFLARHALRVLEGAEDLHLTSIRDPDAFLERHIGESLEGAALIPRGTSGAAIDLGSGNGYPGIPVAAMHPGLRMHLAESSAKKATFLESVVRDEATPIVVVSRAIQRASDVADLPVLGVITTRAMGGWERIVPRLLPRLAAGGRVVLWAGDAATDVARRVAWRKLELIERRVLPGRDRSWILMYYKNTA